MIYGGNLKISLSPKSRDGLGGGWSFTSNLIKGMGDLITDYEESDIYFIPGASMTTKEDVEKAKKDGKKIVLRCDNILRNSRNRNSGMSRMKSFAEMADLVIYQSQFARELLMPFLGVDGVVILNGCDTSLFNTSGREEAEAARFIYSRVNRDETKNWEMARFLYQQESYYRDGKALLNLVGEYSPELKEYNFDFYMGEYVLFWGVIKDPKMMARIYKQSDYLIYTFWNDCCSNTLIEALCSGCEILDPYGMSDTGGAPEILRMFEDHGGSEYFKLDRMISEYRDAIGAIL